PPPPGVRPVVPFGVPRPVGPSQPVPASQMTVPQLPLLPDVTSKKLLACAYGYDTALSPALGVPASAQMPATIGVARLVPPNWDWAPLTKIVMPVFGSASAEMSAVARLAQLVFTF